MSFVDPAFAWFLLAFGVAWLLVRGRYRAQIAVMLVGSLIFYAHDRWWTLAVIVAYGVIDWATGLWLRRARRPRVVLALGVGFNLGVLAAWKYLPLVATAVAPLTGSVGPGAIGAEAWIVPVGISFYAFTGIAYMVDVYRGVTEPEPSLWRYGVFTSFFPHLVAGPILRASEFIVHLRPGTLPGRPLAPWEGSFLVARGFFKKLVLADSIAGAVDPFFANVAHPSTAGVWALPYVYLYAAQIYLDFSGYTDIARGLGLWFGFRWPENFRWPYLAPSIREFWRRWHMTLSRFLRDYLYVPLGGGRGGRWRAATSLMLTMLLGGLWHGASWSFALWGGLHGVFLVIHRVWTASPARARLARAGTGVQRAWTAASVALTFHAVCLGWCFFRLTEWRQSLACLRKCLVFDLDKALAGGSADGGVWLLLVAYGFATALASLLTRGAPLEAAARRIERTAWVRGACWGGAVSVMVLALLLAPGRARPPFIYFQF